MRRKRLLEVEPNHAHRLLVELEKWYDVTVITQNCEPFDPCHYVF